MSVTKLSHKRFGTDVTDQIPNPRSDRAPFRGVQSHGVSRYVIVIMCVQYIGRESGTSSNEKARRLRCDLHHKNIGSFISESVNRVVVIPEESVEVDLVSQPI